VFNAFSAAVITLLQFLVAPQQTVQFLRWLIGVIRYEQSGTLVVGAVSMPAAVGALVVLCARLNLLTLGEDEAASLGIHVGRTRAAVLLAASAATGAAVAVSGMVGFVGLIVPHAARRVLGPDPRLLLPASALFGAAHPRGLRRAGAGRVRAARHRATGGRPHRLPGGPLFLRLLRRADRPGHG